MKVKFTDIERHQFFTKIVVNNMFKKLHQSKITQRTLAETIPVNIQVTASNSDSPTTELDLRVRVLGTAAAHAEKLAPRVRTKRKASQEDELLADEAFMLEQENARLARLAEDEKNRLARLKLV